MNGVTLPLALAAGVVSFASPCFLPIVPVYVGYLAGGTPPGEIVPRRTVLAQACAFVAGFSIVFVGLWASIGLLDYALGDQRGALRVAGGTVLVVMGLHVAGLIEVPVLRRSVRPIAPRVGAVGAAGTAGTAGTAVTAPGGIVTQQRPCLRRSALLGLAFGAGWSPCIGPILGGILGMATLSGTAREGTLLLVAYCVGLGLPFVLVALGAQAVHRRLAVLRRHETLVSLASGALLMTVGFLMITNLFARLTGLIPSVGL